MIANMIAWSDSGGGQNKNKSFATGTIWCAVESVLKKWNISLQYEVIHA
jgi:hypothetical protein